MGEAGGGALPQTRKQKLRKLTANTGATPLTPGKAALCSEYVRPRGCALPLQFSEEHRDAVPGGSVTNLLGSKLLIIFY